MLAVTPTYSLYVQVGDLVWAKVAGWPWWPAAVVTAQAVPASKVNPYRDTHGSKYLSVLSQPAKSILCGPKSMHLWNQATLDAAEGRPCIEGSWMHHAGHFFWR